MSSLPYYNDDGYGKNVQRPYHYHSQAVTVDNIINYSGQDGWIRTGKIDATDIPGPHCYLI
ncbi:hypothetical protein SPOG_05033 [Schizosaccharomyces cryophilus OY26]|uniref:Uncharacterized protein n=1 Tax=Schizosaccharomyces cryophilus (strain OY26 / ATCC MYA-4695 / CBS 11777 / NBRC 106824 / NRRL Y48691) TaxID=653667 RepID=S9W157_SCHCR|nr:uncharacterized protein SPOG_05033 [Schizosaccharomyces cryophilus OY26]EPY52224.1 hypothetical protein SPOG_05033 [Schizosaccharomyces cryophilus OY26]